MTMRYTIEVHEHGLLVCAGDRGLPVSDLDALVDLGRALGYDRMDAGISSAKGATLALVNEGSSAAWRKIIEDHATQAHADPLDVWLAGPDCGISALTIVQAITARPVLRGFAPALPHDVGDFGRCVRLLQNIPGFRSRLHVVADTYPDWAPLVQQWDELEELYLAGESYQLHEQIRAHYRGDHDVTP